MNINECTWHGLHMPWIFPPWIFFSRWNPADPARTSSNCNFYVCCQGVALTLFLMYNDLHMHISAEMQKIESMHQVLPPHGVPRNGSCWLMWLVLKTSTATVCVLSNLAKWYPNVTYIYTSYPPISLNFPCSPPTMLVKCGTRVRERHGDWVWLGSTKSHGPQLLHYSHCHHS